MIPRPCPGHLGALATTIAVCCVASSSTPWAAEMHPSPERKLVVQVNRKVEVVAAIWSLAECAAPFGTGKTPPSKDALEWFASLRDHRAVRWVDDLHCGLSLLIQIALASSPVPEARVQDRDALQRREWYVGGDTLNEVEFAGRFLADVNDFYRQANFDSLFARHEAYYRSIEDDVRRSLPDDAAMSALERFYGDTDSFCRYLLAPSAMVPRTWGFGGRVHWPCGTVAVETFGPIINAAVWDSIANKLRRSQPGDARFDEPDGLWELSVHEFGHSFVIPLIEAHAEQISRSARLLEPIARYMERQGYGSRNWSNIVNEHIARMGEIKVATALGDSARARRLYDEYVYRRKWIYLPYLLKNIEQYERNRDRWPTLADYFPTLLSVFDTIDPDEAWRAALTPDDR